MPVAGNDIRIDPDGQRQGRSNVQAIGSGDVEHVTGAVEVERFPEHAGRFSRAAGTGGVVAEAAVVVVRTGAIAVLKVQVQDRTVGLGQIGDRASQLIGSGQDVIGDQARFGGRIRCAHGVGLEGMSSEWRRSSERPRSAEQSGFGNLDLDRPVRHRYPGARCRSFG